jgi:CRP-like cAMP-binding protein
MFPCWIAIGIGYCFKRQAIYEEITAAKGSRKSSLLCLFYWIIITARVFSRGTLKKSIGEWLMMELNILRQIPLFANLKDQDLEELSRQLQKVTAAPQETIFWIGDLGDNLFLVREGQVDLSYPDENGREITLAKLGPGSFFGDLSLLDGGPRTATARAQTDTILFALDRATFYHFLETHPAEFWPLLATLTSRLRRNSSQLQGLTSLNEQVADKITPLQRSVDQITRTLASGRFLIFTLVFFLAWMGLHSYMAWQYHRDKITFLDDPPTFYWLALMVALASFMLTILVLNTQRRQAERNRIRAEIEYQVNLKAQTEVMILQHKMDQVLAHLQPKQPDPAADKSPAGPPGRKQ